MYLSCKLVPVLHQECCTLHDSIKMKNNYLCAFVIAIDICFENLFDLLLWLKVLLILKISPPGIKVVRFICTRVNTVRRVRGYIVVN